MPIRRRLFAIALCLSLLGNAVPSLPTPLNPPTGGVPPIVVIDPGHGGADWGAVDGLKEKDAVLAIATHTAKILENHGVKVILTRKGDYFIGLDDRVNISNRSKADVFVSIHANYYENSKAIGVETFHYGSGRVLAEKVQTAIVENLQPVNRGVKTARFLVLRKSSIPAILVETGFISNQIEQALLATPDYQVRMGQAIALGILDYLEIPLLTTPAK